MIRLTGARPRRAALALAFGLLATAAAAESRLPRVGEGPVHIAIHAALVPTFEFRDPSRRRFGALAFRGGLVLSSPHPAFGGLSAIRMEADGARFLAVSDHGRWLRGRIVSREGRPAAIEDAEMAPILGPDGKPLAVHRWYDSEALAVSGSTAYVGIERANQVVRFDYGRDGLAARGRPIALPALARHLPYNKGIEGLVVVPQGMPLAGTLIALSERGLDADGNIRAFLIGGRTPGSFAIRRSDGFDLTDCDVTPDGHLLVLERYFAWLRGVGMRIRRIPLAAIKPGALVDGDVLIKADLGDQIDNMEGLAVHRTGEGETVLTLVSDNNFSAIQRTVLLQFTLVEP